MSQDTRRKILKAAVAASALSAVPFISARAQSKAIRIGIPTAITGGYALLGSQAQRTCRLVQKMVNAKGGVIGRPGEFLYQDTAGRPPPPGAQVQGPGQGGRRRHPPR